MEQERRKARRGVPGGIVCERYKLQRSQPFARAVLLHEVAEHGLERAVGALDRAIAH